MRKSLAVWLVLPVILAVPLALPSSSGVEACRGLSPDELPPCLFSWADEAPPPGPHAVSALDGIVAGSPDLALAVLGRLLERYRADAEPAFRADLLDRRGTALAELSRPAESAAVLVEALELDDGLNRLRWLAEPGGDEVWAAELAEGKGRHLRLARALLASGDADGARPYLEQAVSLGARGASESAREAGVEIAGTSSMPLLGPRWFPPVPDLELEMLDGTPRRLRDSVGNVLILDFWASWCTPCKLELPKLQDLHAVESARGLEVLTVNLMDEPGAAVPFAEEFGLELPIARYDDDMDRYLHVTTLPTLILADRKGRIRARWNGYKEGLEAEVAANARRFLEGDDAVQDATLAEVLVGGSVDVVWNRESRNKLEMLEPLSTSLPAGRVVAVVAGRSLALYDSEGRVVRRSDAPFAPTRTISGDLDGDGFDEMVGYRPGGKGLVAYAISDGEHARFDAPSPVLSAAIVEASGPDTPGSLVLATLDGLYTFEPTLGPPVLANPDLRNVMQLLRYGAEGSLLARTSDPAVITLGPDLQATGTHPDGSVASAALVAADGTPGLGALSSAAIAATTGRFIERGEKSEPGTQQLAVAVADQLIVIDLAAGRTLVRARWDGIRDLAAIDFDGDGTGELVVATDRRLVLLRL